MGGNDKMNCERHPNSGEIWLGDITDCYGCYCKQYDYCPICGYEWSDPRECKKGNEEDKMTDLHDLIHKYPKEPRMERWWECYVERTDGGYHHQHWTLGSAQKEAERLSRLTGKTVYLFECVGKCKVEEKPVKWEIPTNR